MIGAQSRSYPHGVPKVSTFTHCNKLTSRIVSKPLIVRATGHKTPGESSVNITVSVYDTTHLQENPQRIG